MLYWLRFPFIRFTLFLCAGITLYDSVPGYCPFLSGIFAVLLLSYPVMIILLRKDRFRKYNMVPGLFSMIILGLAGYLISAIQDDKNLKDHLVHYSGPIESYSGKVLEITRDDSMQVKYIIACRSASNGSDWENHSGKVLVTMYKELPEQKGLAKPGDLVLVRGTPRRIQAPGNPGQFDYSEFMRRKNIFFQHVSHPEDIHLVYEGPSMNLLFLFRQLSEKMNLILASKITDHETWALVSALTLGVKEHLDETTIRDFTKAGINHILAVSGLHVGILYLVLVILLRPVYNRPKTGPSSSIMIILILIAYAFITGLSPSVLRSVVMFTFIEMGRRMGRKAVTLNTLAASAFFLLCVNPNFIYFVGFQLSYLAVAGIVIFQSRIYRMLSFESLVLDYFWQLISVSIAAQITTFPLTVYYFHTFPVYFILANIIAIPASFILLIIGFAIISLHFIPFFGNFLGWVAVAVTWALNHAIHELTNLPVSQINGIYLNKFMVICLFLVIAMVLQTMIERKTGFLYVSAIMLVLFSIAVMHYKMRFMHQNKIICYRMNAGPLIELVNGSTGIVVRDHTTPISDERIADIIGNHCLAEKHPYIIPVGNELHRKITYSNHPGFDLIIWKAKVLYVIYDARKLSQSDSQPAWQADYIIISHNSAYRTDELLNVFETDNWIIDASNSPGSVDYAKKIFKLKNITPYSIPDQGAVTFQVSNHP